MYCDQHIGVIEVIYNKIFFLKSLKTSNLIKIYLKLVYIPLLFDFYNPETIVIFIFYIESKSSLNLNTN